MIGLLLLALSEVSYAPECPCISGELSKAIGAHAQELRGLEFCSDRDARVSDTTELVLYSISGSCLEPEHSIGSCGNRYERFLIGIKNGRLLGPYKLDFGAEEIDVKGNVVELIGYKLSLIHI